MQGAGTLGHRALFEVGAHQRIRRRDVEDVERGAHVQARTADDDGAPAAREDGGDVGARPLLEASDRRLVEDVERVDLVMRDAPTLVRRELGRPDVHAAVELGGVGVDDLAAETLGEVERQVALARRRRADERDDLEGRGRAVHGIHCGGCAGHEAPGVAAACLRRVTATSHAAMSAARTTSAPTKRLAPAQPERENGSPTSAPTTDEPV